MTVAPLAAPHPIFISICLWCLPSHCSSARAQEDCLRTSESVCRLFRRTPASRTALSLSHLKVGILAGFHIKLSWGLLFPALVLWAGKPDVELQCLTPRGDFCSWDIPHDSRPPQVGVGSDCFEFSLLLPVLTLFLLYFLSYRISVQLGWIFYNLIMILMWSWE